MFPSEFSASVIVDEGGLPLCTFGSFVDITTLKEAEEERLALEVRVQSAQRLESLGVLAGGIAHDFNNVLMGVLGNADLALMDLAPDIASTETPRRHRRGREAGCGSRQPDAGLLRPGQIRGGDPRTQGID